MTLPILLGRADEVTIVDVATGEALDPHDATNEQLAAWRRAVIEWEIAARLAKKAVDAVVLERMDNELGEWTIRAGRYTLSAPSPAPTEEWPDPEALASALRDVGLADGIIAKAVRAVTVLKVQASGIKALRKLNRPDVDAVLEAHCVRSERNRYVTVKEA